MDALKDKYFRRCKAQDELFMRLRDLQCLLDWLYTELPGTVAFDVMDGAVAFHRFRMFYDDLCSVRFNVAFLVQWLEQEIATRRPP